MSRVLALMQGNVVTNVIIASPADFPGSIDVTDVAARPAPGWLRQGQTFVPPPAPPAPSLGAKVTRLAFRQRLGDATLVAIELAALDNPTAPAAQRQLAAQLRVLQENVRIATFIDLSRPDTRAGVQSLEAAGLLPAGKALEVLDAPVQQHEVPLGV